MKTLRERIEGMTMEQRRARLAEISVMAGRGDYSWSYDEYVLLTELVPTEKAANERAAVRARRRAARR